MCVAEYKWKELMGVISQAQQEARTNPNTQIATRRMRQLAILQIASQPVITTQSNRVSSEVSNDDSQSEDDEDERDDAGRAWEIEKIIGRRLNDTTNQVPIFKWPYTMHCPLNTCVIRLNILSAGRDLTNSLMNGCHGNICNADL